MLKKLLLTICIPSVSFANDKNILNCSYDNFYKTACSINDVTLSENEPFQMDFEVSYIYDCQGHNFEAGVQTDTGFYPFKRGKGTQTVVATGASKAIHKSSESHSSLP